MSEWLEFTGKTVDEAISAASLELQTASDNFTYEVLERESSGFLGINKKLAKIRVCMKMSLEDTVKSFLQKVFDAMKLNTEIAVLMNEEEKCLEINVLGDDMGLLIGKRGQTLDSLQYLVSLVANKGSEEYIKIKLDTENYRERRKETLENLAKNIAFKVKRTRHSVSLEPMNPYERRIIHSALQNDKFVETHSEGEEPYRKVVISLKKGARDYGSGQRYHQRSGYGSQNKRSGQYGSGNRSYKKPYQYAPTKTSDITESASE